MFKLNGFEWRVFLVSPSHPLLIKPDSSLAIGVCDKETQKIYEPYPIYKRIED